MAKIDRFAEAALRQKIIDALKIDLIGPVEPNEVMDQDPASEYLTGMIYAKSLADDLEFGEQEVGFDFAHEDDYSTGAEEENDDVQTNGKFEKPSSIGLSFYVKKETKVVKIVASWGDYKKREELVMDEKGKEKKEVCYERIPRSATFEIDLSSFGKHKVFPVEEEPRVQLRVSKIGLKNEYMLVTVYLLNRRLGNEEKTAQIMFQTRIDVYSEDGFYAESICRQITEAEEHFYSERPIFGRGRGCAASWDPFARDVITHIHTSFIPEYEIPGVSPNIEGFDKNHFWMTFMARPSNKVETIARLNMLADSYERWINEKLKSDPLMADESFKAKIGNQAISKCEEALRRIRDGINIINTNDIAFDAFSFMNSVMTYQRSIMSYSKKCGSGVECSIRDYIDTEKKEDHFCWRPFQIAFVLMNIRSIVDPLCKERAMVDLLYFPTGGGKTEAYLGLIAFTIAHRRLIANPMDIYNRDGGVTVILRYTLRNLTTQQRDRLTKMIVAAEILRKKTYPKYGTEPFSIGFWVGGGVTPNKFADLKETDDPDHHEVVRKNMNLLTKQLLVCPYCGKPLSEKNYHVNPDKHSVDIYCSENDKCIFYHYRDDRMPVPVYFVDEEIYSKCPTVILATVDKFAYLPWHPNANALFGRVDRKCDRDGYIAMGNTDHPKRHTATEHLPAASVHAIKPFAPPELIVQDELHLITGPLGTIYGAYETMIQELCTYTVGDKKILPKYVVSTATIKNADEQTKCLYARKETAQFPPNGFVSSDSFFTKEIPLQENSFRRYVGISGMGQSVKTTLLRVYAVVLQTAFVLSEQEENKALIDPYYTLVGYFNSIRELGGAVRLLQDDIPARIYRLENRYDYAKSRKIFQRVEITSRISSTKIGEILKKLETPYGDKSCYDTAIATNMIAVGMDVDRLGLMTVIGQPKQNSEYIQATSRIGRTYPGVVFTIYNPYRPRDLSHYENFTGYHAQLYRHVEGTTATPFSDRARDRVLHALIISAMRLKYPQMGANNGAKNILTLSSDEINSVIELIEDRLAIVNPAARADTKAEIEQFIDKWKKLAIDKKDLRYYVVDTEKYNRLMNYYGEPTAKDEKPTLNSMREVESASNLYYYWED